MVAKKNIFVLYTGGTIGMSDSAQGLCPDTSLSAKALLPFADRFDFHWCICKPLIDSSAVVLDNWHHWLEVVAANLPQYDGVLMLHGTDTLAYSANLFALGLQGLDKPIVLTGAQQPYGVDGSDAELNLATALAAFDLDLSEVVIAFNGKLFPAVGSSKTSTEKNDGFSNPHFGVLAEWLPEQGWQKKHALLSENQYSDSFHVYLPNIHAKVVCITLVPGFSARYFADNLKYGSLDAVVLQSYGHGNTPSDTWFIEAMRQFIGRGGLVLNISQVLQGNAAAVYAQGEALRRSGVINGGKTNLETATVLLTLAVSSGWRAERVQQELKRLKLV